MDLKNLKNKFKSFGCATVEIDGHNIKKIYQSLINKKQNNKPKVILWQIRLKGKVLNYSKMITIGTIQ